MKVCPICDTTFDEDIIRFCTKDGTPLVDADGPNFIQLPSDDLDGPEDETGEITVVRRKETVPPPPSIEELNRSVPMTPPVTERIVIPTTDIKEPDVRVRPAQVYYPPAAPQNTAKVVALTIFGTIAAISLGALLFWLLQKDGPANTNVNVNTNLGTFNGNLGANNALDNFNFNSIPNYNANYGSGANIGTNFNTNFNVKTPTPTPTPTPKPSPSVTPSPTPDENPDATPTPRPSPRPLGSPRPSISPTPRMGPRPTPNPNSTPN